jgi:hypothetical protein
MIFRKNTELKEHFVTSVKIKWSRWVGHVGRKEWYHWQSATNQMLIVTRKKGELPGIIKIVQVSIDVQLLRSP